MVALTPRQMAEKRRGRVTPPARTPAPVHPVTAYAQDVVAGRIVAGPYIRLAAKRHLDDLRRSDPDFPWVFDPDQADRFYLFASYVNLTDGVPLKLEPFQMFIQGCIFGWVHRDTRLRRFSTAYIELGKGNGKTPLAAVTAMYCLVADDEPAPEVYFAATSRDQANIGFEDAKKIAESSPRLKDLLKVEAHNIAFRDGWLRSVSSEARSLDGKRPHASFLDEIHEHRTPVVLQKMRLGMKARRQPINYEITNSGNSRTTICWEHHQHSIAVLEGTVRDDRWFAYVASLDTGDDWRNPDVWVKANPGLGTILPVDYLKGMVQEAQNIPSSENLVKRLNFCIWTEQLERWLPMVDWDRCSRAVDWDEYEGEPAFFGLDLASRHDFTAGLLYFPRDHAVRPYFWLPEDMRQRTEADRELFTTWARMGFVELTPGNVTDFDRVGDQIMNEIATKYDIQELPYDQWNATQLATQLANAGADVVPMQQGGAHMSEGAKELARLVSAGELVHDGNPVLRWMASNVAVLEDLQGNLKLSRDKSGDRIDGIAALVMAISRGMVWEDTAGGWIIR